MDFNEHTPGRIFHSVKYLITLGSALFGEHAAQITEALETLERDGTLETLYRYVETRFIEPIAEQIKDKQEVRANAVLAAEVIEQETIVVEQEIAELEAKSAAGIAEIAEINERYDHEEQDLNGKIDALAQNYFDKHPDLSDDDRNKANETFGAIREEEMGKLRSGREAELDAKSREQQPLSKELEELEERRKELEGTRADRS
jgi:hypothetical protein